jgi:methylase of polypeptide subunit release factors
MSQRDSGYARKERDLYETPEWVTEAVVPHLTRLPGCIWEPAMGSGKMVRVLMRHTWITGTDIAAEYEKCRKDFLACPQVLEAGRPIDAIITNPPYELAQEFIEHALRLMEPVGGPVAMLLRTDFDHAKSRAHLFRDCPAFAKKLVLMKRITWFEPEPGAKGKSPSFNHAWYIWDWKHEGPPSIAYGP